MDTELVARARSRAYKYALLFLANEIEMYNGLLEVMDSNEENREFYERTVKELEYDFSAILLLK